MGCIIYSRSSLLVLFALVASFWSWCWAKAGPGLEVLEISSSVTTALRWEVSLLTRTPPAPSPWSKGLQPHPWTLPTVCKFSHPIAAISLLIHNFFSLSASRLRVLEIQLFSSPPGSLSGMQCMRSRSFCWALSNPVAKSMWLKKFTVWGRELGEGNK